MMCKALAEGWVLIHDDGTLYSTRFFRERNDAGRFLVKEEDDLGYISESGVYIVRANIVRVQP